MSVGGFAGGRWLSQAEIDWHREELAYAEHKRRDAEARLADAQRRIRDLEMTVVALTPVLPAAREIAVVEPWKVRG